MNRWAWIWIFLLILWTLGLVFPLPPDEQLPFSPNILSRKFIIAKSLHIFMYFLLTYLVVRLEAKARFRWVFLFVLMVHAPITELIQRYVSNRMGTLEDVGFDHLGVFLGLLAGWKGWTKNS